MELDKSRIYTAVNADELKVGSTCVFADSLQQLKANVEAAQYDKLGNIYSDAHLYRFVNTRGCVYPLAYFVEEPAKLKWTDLKVGDVIRYGGITAMVTVIDSLANPHIFASTWLDDMKLSEWEKVEE